MNWIYFFFFLYMKIEQLREIAQEQSLPSLFPQLTWSKEVWYVFVERSPFDEGEYEIIVPAAWPANCEINLSWQWAIHMATNEDHYNLLCGTPLEVYSFSISRLMAEMENLILNVTSFVRAHEGLSQKEFAEVVNQDHFAKIMNEDRSIKSILFEARKTSPREAVNAFYKKYASGLFLPVA